MSVIQNPLVDMELSLSCPLHPILLAIAINLTFHCVSDVCRFKMFSIMYTGRNPGYSINLPSRVFSVQRNTWCPLQNCTTGCAYAYAYHVSSCSSKLVLESEFQTFGCWVKMPICYILTDQGVILQEGFARLWRGTNAGLALAVPTVGSYVLCFWKILILNVENTGQCNLLSFCLFFISLLR